MSRRRVLIAFGIAAAVAAVPAVVVLQALRRMSDIAWLQSATRAELRESAHTLARCSMLVSAHDAFLVLQRVGTKESVPILIDALWWMDSGPGDRVVCTHAHAVSALESITGLRLGLRHESWAAWWSNSGRDLPASSFADPQRLGVPK